MYHGTKRMTRRGFLTGGAGGAAGLGAAYLLNKTGVGAYPAEVPYVEPHHRWPLLKGVPNMNSGSSQIDWTYKKALERLYEIDGQRYRLSNGYHVSEDGDVYRYSMALWLTRAEPCSYAIPLCGDQFSIAIRPTEHPENTSYAAVVQWGGRRGELPDSKSFCPFEGVLRIGQGTGNDWEWQQVQECKSRFNDETVDTFLVNDKPSVIYNVHAGPLDFDKGLYAVIFKLGINLSNPPNGRPESRISLEQYDPQCRRAWHGERIAIGNAFFDGPIYQGEEIGHSLLPESNNWLPSFQNARIWPVVSLEDFIRSR